MLNIVVGVLVVLCFGYMYVLFLTRSRPRSPKHEFGALMFVLIGFFIIASGIEESSFGTAEANWEDAVAWDGSLFFDGNTIP